MEPFQWGKHFETKLTIVDEQHHHLVDLINAFGHKITEDKLNQQDIDSLFQELVDYTVYHFQDEEQMMISMNIDRRHFHKHHKAHQHFLDDVNDIYHQLKNGDLTQTNSLLQYLIHWLGYHILGQDQDMAKQIKAIESGQPPEDAFQQLENERLSATAPLLAALNGLFDQVSLRNHQLKKLNENLEEKVAQRTKELSQANEHLEQLSLTDVLTTLPNRRHAMKALSAYWQESQQQKAALTCMMIDADHFKEVNDTYGHKAGDNVLITIANTFTGHLRNDDSVYRLGGDEFLIICPNTDYAGAMHVAKSTLNKIQNLRVDTGGEPWHGSISIGVAVANGNMDSYETLISHADAALYKAKEAGKNCIR